MVSFPFTVMGRAAGSAMRSTLQRQIEPADGDLAVAGGQ